MVTEMANSLAAVAYWTNSGPYSRWRSAGAAIRMTMPQASETATPAPLTKRDTLTMPGQPRSASCLVASGRPKLPPALMTSVVGPATSPWAAFKPPSAVGPSMTPAMMRYSWVPPSWPPARWPTTG